MDQAKAKMRSITFDNQIFTIYVPEKRSIEARSTVLEFYSPCADQSHRAFINELFLPFEQYVISAVW